MGKHSWVHGKGLDEPRDAKPLREVNLEALRELSGPPTKSPHDDTSSGPTTPKTTTSATGPDSGRQSGRPKLAFSAELLNRGTTAKRSSPKNTTRVDTVRSKPPRLSFTDELLKASSSKKKSRPKLRSASLPDVLAGNPKKGGGHHDLESVEEFCFAV